jgi:hypothetical protein
MHTKSTNGRTHTLVVFTVSAIIGSDEKLDSINTLNGSTQTLECFATKSCLEINHIRSIYVDTCIRGIKTARLYIKQEIHRQTHEQYQYYLATDIIDRRYHHLAPEHSISDKLECDDLIDNKLKYMLEAKARSKLFTMLRFDIKGFIYPHSIKRNALTRDDVMSDGCLTPLTTKVEIEDHLLTRNPQSYMASGTTPFGHTALGRSLFPTGDSPLSEFILDGSFSHPNQTASSFTQQLCHRSHCSYIPAARITEKHFSRALGRLQEKSVSSTSDLYNAHYMCLASKKNDLSSSPIRQTKADLMELPITHGFVPDRHNVRYHCPIYKKHGDFRFESSAWYMESKQRKTRLSRLVVPGK